MNENAAMAKISDADLGYKYTLWESQQTEGF
jgi:hypothetical protein